ncbi:protein of unknown function [Shinella sp. WSC3-e]|nr:hypothetical protein SHINE37_40516 [Rhizobiaceae bacterium]CAK7255195.1 protein of unknown function [Shinella sp. WSC3-e]
MSAALTVRCHDIRTTKNRPRAVAEHAPAVDGHRWPVWQELSAGHTAVVGELHPHPTRFF